MSNPTTDRRTVLATIGSAAVGAVAGCTGALPGGSDGGSEFQNQLDTVREATSQYETPPDALGDGFKPMGPYVPGMGWHLSHPQRGQQIAKNGPSLEKPNLLTFLETDGGLQLGAVEWGIPAGAAPENPDLFADENADATEKWHTHKAATHVFALPDDGRTNPSSVSPDQWLTNDHWAEFRPPSSDLSAGDTVSLHWGSTQAKQGEEKSERVADQVVNHPDLVTLHAWVHTENPDGVFKPTNPEFGGGGHSH